MRILTIGLGGAGCRIVNSLYTTDRRSSKVTCVQTLAIDVNADTLAHLEGLPSAAKLYFPPLDPEIHPDYDESDRTATIDVTEIIARIQNIESGETDAIFVCCGLGGSMVDVAPHIIATLRASIVEPIFGLVTIPCLAEGERRSAKAADDIEMLSPLLDGIILFDNETWYKKIKARKSTLVKKEKGFAEKFGFRKSVAEISPETATYELLNDSIVKRISLILRAGEFMADGGLDHAEVVLDSGEVLNTMKGMGFITIGYAVERLPHNPLGFLSTLRPAGFFADEHNKKASRIVDLAKQAIYHEISTPCDMTSAHKALILIAGPSHELSLNGFMTVRKWIDRSIAGLETRSGDYPVMNTKNVAIIIMLSGLENIPRLAELKEIQSQYKNKHPDRVLHGEDFSSPEIAVPERSGTRIRKSRSSTKKGDALVKDEMIVLAVSADKNKKPLVHQSGKISYPPEEGMSSTPGETRQEISPPLRTAQKIHAAPKDSFIKPAQRVVTKLHITEEPLQENSSRHTPAGNQEPAAKRMRSAPDSTSYDALTPPMPQPKKPSYGTGMRGFDEKHLPRTTDKRMKPKDIERQIIEKELQRQRMMAMAGRTARTGSEESKHLTHPHETIRLKRGVKEKSSQTSDDDPADLPEEIRELPKKRRVVIQKKTEDTVAQKQETDIHNGENTDATGTGDGFIDIRSPAGDPAQSGSEGPKVRIKRSGQKFTDPVREGKDIQESASPQVKDSDLKEADIKLKKSSGRMKYLEKSVDSDDKETESSKATSPRDKRSAKKDDINWI